jgi:hypothetical protein
LPEPVSGRGFEDHVDNFQLPVLRARIFERKGIHDLIRQEAGEPGVNTPMPTLSIGRRSWYGGTERLENRLQHGVHVPVLADIFEDVRKSDQAFAPRSGVELVMQEAEQELLQ